MHSKDTLLAQYDLHTKMFLNSLAGFTDEAANKRAMPGINHVKWLAGHLLAVRVNMGSFAGKDVPFDWQDIFKAGKSVQDDTATYPTLDAVIAKWNEVTPAIRAAFELLTDDKLNEPSLFLQPCGDTFLSMWAFLEHHQAYTIGQVGLIRRMTGLEAIKYN